MLAKVSGVFRISKEIELKYLPSGSAVAKVSLVNSSKYKTQSGEQKKDTCFIDGSVFGKSAEILNQYCSKGSKIYIIGDLVQETWTVQDGTNRSIHKIKIESFEFLDSKQDNQSQPKQQPEVVYENNVPKIDIDDSEIPF